MVEGGMSCVKYILFVFNFIFVIFGGLLIYLGFLVIQDVQGFKELIETPDTMAISVIVLGFCVFLIAFLGCCGALFESHCVLVTFGIIVTVILTLEMTLGGLAFAFQNDLRSTAARNLKDAVSRYNWTDSGSKYSRLIDDLQSTLHCCGFNSSSDWPELNPNQSDRTLLPSSCCARPANSNSTTSPIICHVPGTGSPLSSSGLDQANRNPWSRDPSAAEPPQVGIVYTSNCVDTAADAIVQSIAPIGGACLAIALFQLLGIIFAFCLSRAVKQEYQVV